MRLVFKSTKHDGVCFKFTSYIGWLFIVEFTVVSYVWEKTTKAVGLIRESQAPKRPQIDILSPKNTNKIFNLIWS